MRASLTETSVIRFGSFELDLKNGELRQDGEQVNLQPLPFKLLTFLASHPGDLMSRKRIKDELWPQDNIGDPDGMDLDGMLNFHIKTIRRALADDANDPRYIETKLGEGYKFIADVDVTQFPPEESHSEGARRVPESNGARPRGGVPLWLFVLAVALGAALAVLTVGVLMGRKRSVEAQTGRHATAEHASNGHQVMPLITAVSPILPRRRQEIVVEGHGLGTYTPFTRLDTPFLAIGDETAHWAAGRITPENADDVTLTVTTWTDTDIIITELSGDYGKKWWRLNPGDEIVVRVWNPQTGVGPAEYHLKVSPSVNANRR